MTLNDSEASKLINLISKHSDVKLLYNVNVAKSILKLSDEYAEAFLTVAAKQGDKLTDVFKTVASILMML